MSTPPYDCAAAVLEATNALQLKHPEGFKLDYTGDPIVGFTIVRDVETKMEQLTVEVKRDAAAELLKTDDSVSGSLRKLQRQHTALMQAIKVEATAQLAAQKDRIAAYSAFLGDYTDFMETLPKRGVDRLLQRATGGKRKRL